MEDDAPSPAAPTKAVAFIGPPLMQRKTIRRYSVSCAMSANGDEACVLLHAASEAEAADTPDVDDNTVESAAETSASGMMTSGGGMDEMLTIVEPTLKARPDRSITLRWVGSDVRAPD